MRIKGNSGSVFPGFPRVTYSPTEGRVVYGVTMVRYSQLVQAEQSLISYGYQYEVDAVGRTGYAAIRWVRPNDISLANLPPFDTAPVPLPGVIIADRWRVRYNEEQLSLFNDPDVRADLNKLNNPDQAALLRLDITNYVAGQRQITDPTTGNVTTLNLASLQAVIQGLGLNWQGIWQPLITDLAAGITDELWSGPVLYRSLLVPASTNLAPAFLGLNQILTTPSLLAFESTIPPNLGGQLPPGYWLRKAPEAEQLPDGRWHYQVEYWWAYQLGQFASRRKVAVPTMNLVQGQ